MKRLVIAGIVSAVTVVLTLGILLQVTAEEMYFGGREDVAFAKKVWRAMGDYTIWPIQSDFYPGQSPHGVVLRLYYSVILVDGTPYHVIVKDNYGGPDANVMNVSKNPEKYFTASTIMLQREPGYDPQNWNWFWAKYLPNGDLDKNPKGMQLAGRVAKGMDAGCIACHAGAEGNDYVFTND